MVRIINGEIVQDDDPRVKQSQRLQAQQASTSSSSSNSGSSSSAAPPNYYGGGSSSYYTENRPPSSSPGPPPHAGSSGNIFGLTDVTVFETRITPQVYIMAALAAFVFGAPAIVLIIIGFFAYRYLNARGGLAALPAFLGGSGAHARGSSPPSTSTNPGTGRQASRGTGQRLGGGIRSLHDKQ